MIPCFTEYTMKNLSHPFCSDFISLSFLNSWKSGVFFHYIVWVIEERTVQISGCIHDLWKELTAPSFHYLLFIFFILFSIQAIPLVSENSYQRCAFQRGEKIILAYFFVLSIVTNSLFLCFHCCFAYLQFFHYFSS